MGQWIMWVDSSDPFLALRNCSASPRDYTTAVLDQRRHCCVAFNDETVGSHAAKL